MSRPRIRIVLLGACEPTAAPHVEQALALLPGGATIVRSPAFTDDWPRRAAESSLCIVFENWPDEIPTATVHALIAACAAGRLICCQGAWCASAGRSRAVWPPGVSVPVERLASRIRFELAVLAGECPPLPTTASRDEAFAAHFAPARAPSALAPGP